MVLSMLVAIIAAPGLLGSQEAIRQSQSKEKREEHRARRCNLIATCVKSSLRSREINGRPIVLRNGKLWIDTGTEDGEPLGHPYAGYYLPYPDEKYEGLVTTITDVAPIMNWVYIDRETHEAKYGVRVDAQPNLTGPFDCTRQDRRMTFDGWEGWCAVEEAAGLWALYFDVGDDGLRSKVAPGTRVLEIELSRKEKRFAKEAGARMQDQTTKRKVDAQEDAPVDEPLAPKALVEKPGVVDEAQQEAQEESQSVREEPQDSRPFRIPKSIFENPPPILESSVFKRPLTPPPAYSTTMGQGTPEPNVDVTRGDMPAVLSVKKEERTSTTRLAATVSTSASQPTDPALMRGTKNSPPAKTTPDRSTSPPTSRSRSTSEKRTTPKLNRNSGSRALAQAQKFEAMAAGQKQKDEARPRNGRRISRASSNGDSGSEYSRDSQELEEEFKSTSKGISPGPSMPAPLATSASLKPKALPLKRADTQQLPRSIPNDGIPRPRTPPRQRALTDPKDPAVFGAEPSKRNGTREPFTASGTRENSVPRPPPSTRRPAQTSNQSPRPPLQRRGTVDRAGSPRAPPARQHPTAVSSPRIAAQPQANRGATRTSLASTMTTGQGNRAMTSRVSGSGERGRSGRSVGMQSPVQASGRSAGGRKTTSALFREIDELVSQDMPSNGT